MECLAGCMPGCTAVRIHSLQTADSFADKRQEPSDNMAAESLENLRGILGCLLMIYSSYHLFYARYHQSMPGIDKRAYPN